MKKIIWLLLLFMFVFKVDAKTYYSNYSEEKISKEYIKASDTVSVEQVNYYNWYKKDKVLLDYKLFDSKGTFDNNDCYYTDLTAYTNVKPNEHEGRIVETENTYIYKVPRKVRYIHLTDLQGSYRSIRITELMVLINGVDIDYDYICDGCWGEFDSHIHNGIWNENMSYIANGGSLIIDLKKEYSISELNLIFYLFDMAHTIKTYTIGFSLNPNYVYATESYSLDFYVESAKDSKMLSYNIYNMNIHENKWTEQYITTNKLKNGYISEVIETNYRYKELWCREYMLEDRYSNIYSDNPPDGYDLVDLEDYVIYYKYKTRKKIIIEDIIINSEEQKISDFISTDDNYKIIGNINFKKNGTYLITIETNYIKVNTNVVIDMLKNDIQSSFLEELSKLREKFYKEKNKNENNKVDKNIFSIKSDITDLYSYLELLNIQKNNIENYVDKCIEINNQTNNLKIENIDKGIDLYEADLLIEEIVKEYELNKILLKEINSNLMHISNNIIDYLTKVNNAYYNKIIEFKNSQDKTNEHIKEVIKHEEELKDYYELELLKQKNESIDVKNEIPIKKEHISNNNNLLLNIKKENKNIIIFIILIALSIFGIIAKLQKKSVKKNN